MSPLVTQAFGFRPSETTYQSRVFAEVSLELPRLTEFSFAIEERANIAFLTGQPLPHL